MSTYLRWSKLPYAGEKTPPKNPVEPLAGSWPTYYLKRSRDGSFQTPAGQRISLAIRNPNTINWYRQLKFVQYTLNNITPQQIKIAKYWGDGPPTKQWTPIMDRLIDTYGVSAPRAARILAATQTAINDIFVVVWYLKYKWDVARPDQLDQKLATIVCTPRFPTYPSGHAAVSGTAAEVLTHFFPPEAKRLAQLAQEDAKSRLYAGVHFNIDDNQGLRLGRQIGRIIVNVLKNQRNAAGQPIDPTHMPNKHAVMMPPPYRQVMPYPYPYPHHCQSLLRPTKVR
ncbi:vanadium-dependent haloperoxidase [Marininema halotolerans]|uniref:PAP2 superfamily protein n=1 Tax=Marininema halotolerans TaxID=1155944 RepID=A0A1I6QGX3_9BACL|nr:vanadium-dependent haloperoxidase [Marininema halotolerans]SFS51733.1 PAP2 superfamily protein [Marininema halotolerans]